MTDDDPNAPITLVKFVQQERRRLHAFSDWWRKAAIDAPDEFPMQMPPGEWGEHYLVFDPAWADEENDR